MSATRRIILVTHTGAELLDIIGPSAVFSMASRLAGRDIYSVAVAATGRTVTHSCGITLATIKLDDLVLAPSDTVLVAGAEAGPLVHATADPKLRRFLLAAQQRVERLGSVCTGAFILGAAGLLRGKRATTHWAGRRQLAEMFPGAQVNDDALYVQDGRLWTSAGVTTGIDMALAMVEQDHGPALKAQVAKRLVVYAHRPGQQSQFSDVLEAQSRLDDRFTGLIEWLRTRTDQAVSVEQMAAQVNMTPRSFHRHFTHALSVTPAKFFENMRMDRARDLLAAGAPVHDVAASTGFGSEAAFRAAFKARFAVTPLLYRNLQR